MGQKEALFSQIRTKMPEEAKELDRVLRALAEIGESGTHGFQFAGMPVIDAIGQYFEYVKRPAREQELIDALLSGGAGRGKKRPALLAIQETIRVWTEKERLFRKDGLIWPAEWGDNPKIVSIA